jgi:hypothetical protein
MVARRLTLAVLVSVCVLACALMVAAGSAAAATQFEFGSFGSEAGQFNRPHGVAVDAAGDVYVADPENNRVEKFDKSGSFLLAWGAGVVDGANELETCTTSCRRGLQSSIAGGFEFPTGTAVDAAGDVYVVDKGHQRVEKFDSEGKFILMFGGHVNETTGEDVCTAASKDVCTIGVTGTANGEFSFWQTLGSFIATGPGGKVYVGDTGRVQVFEPSGAWKENISLAGVASEEVQPTALAVDSAGDVFLSAAGVEGAAVEGVREFEANGTEKSTQFDVGSTSVSALTVDASGDLYVADSNGGFHVLKYDPAGNELAGFGSKTVSGPSDGIAFSATTGELYASESEEEEKASVWVLTPPPPGPLIDSQSAEPFPKGKATLKAQINPEGNETTYHFEYVDQAQFQASGYASATSTPPVSIGSSFEDQPAIAELAGRIPGETYHWRVVATDSVKRTTTGADQSFEETPAALIEGPWTENVASTSVTLAARINPLGANTSYRLEYGTTTSYEHVLTGNVGEGTESALISRHVQELEPGTIYHYRLVTSSVVGTVQGVDHTFTTQPATALQASLPDGRAWELVTPGATKGAVLGLPETPAITAASDGGAITYPVVGAPLGEEVESNQPLLGGNLVFSQRGQDAWRSRELALRLFPLVQLGSLPSDGTHYSLFSSDLASSVVDPPAETPASSLAPEGLEGTPYLRNTAGGSYEPLLTATNTPAGTELMVTFHGGRLSGVHPAAGTPDLGHVVLASHLKLTEEAVQFGTAEASGAGNLYEWGAGRLQLVNRLPGTNKPTQDPVSVELAGESSGQGQVQRAVSSDGRWVAWTRGDPYGAGDLENYKGLYLRDMVEGKTVQLGGHGALYQTMSSDGARVFFVEGGELYEYDTTTATLTGLTAVHGAGEATAGLQQWVSDVSEDGTYVYFVATGKLVEGAVSGADNLYLLHEAAGKWTTGYVATLSSEDAPSWHGTTGTGEPYLVTVTSRVSPDGRYLTFMSERSLTGYDNIDANSPPGEPRHDVEVYIYDATAGHLACASCVPSGARPVGVPSGRNGQLVEGEGANWSHGAHPHWLGGALPGWLLNNGMDTVSQPRYLSNSGRLFFDSPDALVPQDTNGLEDVYEYEPPGIGGCTSASPSFSARSGGCVALISSGVSKAESGFMDASETGDSVFFLSSDRLSPSDLDSGYDVWDARVCTAAAPCLTPPVSPPPCSSGDSCKPAPTPQPELFGPAPSATFSGPGNAAPAPAVTSKPPTRLQKLSKALASCRTRYRRSKKRRAACERTAHKHYGYAAKRANRAKTIKRGGK